MDEYAAGRTPNPCLRCNEKIKFAAVLDRALALGFDAVATGHYARLRTGDDGLVELHRAVDHGKDQSYVLGVLDQEQLAHSLFPLGDTPKPRCAPRPTGAGCWSPTSPTRHDICFVADGDNAGWLREKLGDRAPNHGGDIVDEATGEVLGSTRAPTGSPSASARACGSAGPPPTASRASCSTSSRSPAPSRSGRARLAVDRLTGIRPRWCGTVPEPPRGHRPAARPRGRAPRRSSTPADGDGVDIELLDPA